MNEGQCVHVLKELAGLNGGVRSVQRFGRKPRKQRAMERRCWTCGRSRHIAAICPSRPDAVGRKDETTHGRSNNAGAHDRAFSGPTQVETLGTKRLETSPEHVHAESIEHAIETMGSWLNSGSGEKVFTFTLPKTLATEFQAIMEGAYERKRNHGIKSPSYDERDIFEINAEEKSCTEKHIQGAAPTVHGVEYMGYIYPQEISGTPEVNAERSVEADNGKGVNATRSHKRTPAEDEKDNVCTGPAEPVAYGPLPTNADQETKEQSA